MEHESLQPPPPSSHPLSVPISQKKKKKKEDICKTPNLKPILVNVN